MKKEKDMQDHSINLDYVSKNCREGFILNPNQKIVQGIIRGINRCNGECPCHHEDDGDKHCPCEQYRIHNKCVCTLYIPKEN